MYEYSIKIFRFRKNVQTRVRFLNRDREAVKNNGVGATGDGKIFITSLEGLISICTGQKGGKAI